MRRAGFPVVRVPAPRSLRLARSSRDCPTFLLRWEELHGLLADGKIAQKSKRKFTYNSGGIRWWSPTQLLIHRFKACVWQSGRDAQCSLIYGRMCLFWFNVVLYRYFELVVLVWTRLLGAEARELRLARANS
jgi:hypothetical protein